MTAQQLSTVLRMCLEDAVQSPDLQRIHAVHEIIAIEGAYDLDALLRTIEYDPVDFLLVAAPSFKNALHRATGHSRASWVDAVT